MGHLVTVHGHFRHCWYRTVPLPDCGLRVMPFHRRARHVLFSLVPPPPLPSRSWRCTGQRRPHKESIQSCDGGHLLEIWRLCSELLLPLLVPPVRLQSCHWRWLLLPVSQSEKKTDCDRMMPRTVKKTVRRALRG